MCPQDAKDFIAYKMLRICVYMLEDLHEDSEVE